MSGMKKIEVSAGVFWIQIPEENFYLLCGAPADSVKYLMKKGLIVSTEKDNVIFETGPNTILLSDVMVQNGFFSNLAEFPILQMLYRQGLIIPGHPNNKGSKPLLIGSKEQINAQMEYIYRGNYGLTSVEEIADVGLSREEAEEYMRMKLKFAFGHIRNTSELLDSMIIDDEAIEIKNGIFIRRKRFNVFEITYQQDSYTIDLNLDPNIDYDKPYPLGHYNLERDHFSIIHSGEGDGWDINRSCISSIIMYKGKIYLIDTGPNIHHTLNALGISVDEIEGIFHTHAHDDHFAGLTTLIRSDHKIKYFATALVRSSVAKKFSVLLGIEEECFARLFDVHDLKFDTYFNLDGLEVLPINSPHPIETNIFIFRSMGEDGFKSYAHFADIASFDVLDSMIEEDKSKAGISKAYSEKIKQLYLSKVDIKKIDIGGGMIHGCAEDFRDDPSDTILLSHTALELTNAQKSIGSGAPFGMVNQLIPTYKNYFYYRAYNLLKSYFLEIESHEENIQNLLNSPIITFNPDTIIVKQGENVNAIYLVLSGNVNKINKTDQNSVLISSGSIIGEDALLYDTTARFTYRTNSFVNTLCIAKSLFFYLFKQQNIENAFLHHKEIKLFLRSTPLFEESISSRTINALVNGLESIQVKKGQCLFDYISDEQLAIIRKGHIDLLLDETVVEKLTVTDFFFEDYPFFDSKPLLSPVAAENVTLYMIPGELVKDIPVVYLKVLETRNIRRIKILQALHTQNQWLISNTLNFSNNIQKIDRQRQHIIDAVNILFFFSTLKKKNKAHIHQIKNSIYHLIQEINKHFYSEESLMIMYKYPAFKEHRKEHKVLLKHIKNIQNELETSGNLPAAEQFEAIKTWIEHHFIDEDGDYGCFLNQRGIY